MSQRSVARAATNEAPVAPGVTPAEDIKAEGYAFPCSSGNALCLSSYKAGFLKLSYACCACREEYLRRYKVDDLLQQLLEEVLSNKPNNPASFVAERLAEERDSNRWPPRSNTPALSSTTHS